MSKEQHMKTARRAFKRLTTGTIVDQNGIPHVGKETAWSLVFSIRRNLKLAGQPLTSLASGVSAETIEAALEEAQFGGKLEKVKRLVSPELQSESAASARPVAPTTPTRPQPSVDQLMARDLASGYFGPPLKIPRPH
jgi:hypothetical protein